MVTLKQVNKALKVAGFEGELVKGKDYFYFVSDELDKLRLQTTSVMVNRLSALTVEQWVAEYRTLLTN